MADSENASSSLHHSLPVSTDTPYKPLVHNRVMYGENAHQAQESVKSDLKNNVCILKPDHFCKNFLDLDFSQPLPGIFEKVKDKFYSDRCWKGFPKSKKQKEAAKIKFYKLFVDIAQAVNAVCWEHAPHDVKSVWVDHHSTAPQTLSKDSPDICPNIIQVCESTFSKFEALNNELSVTEDKDEEEKVKKVKKSEKEVRSSRQSVHLS